MSMFLKPFAAFAAAAALVLTGCSGGGNETAEDPTGNRPAEEPQELTVYAAASLTNAFNDIGDAFMEENAGTDVRFEFDGSSALVDKIKQGAPADVFASADQRNMQKATDADVVNEPIEFTDNQLVLTVPAGNPGKITGLDDSLDGKKLIICAPEVPCGNLTKQVAEEAGVELKPVSEEQKVTDVRGKIESGEGDAGLVYTTDAMAAGDKVEVIPMDVVGTNIYPIAVVKESKNPELAQKFIDYVLGEKGQEIMKSYGFTPPGE